MLYPRAVADYVQRAENLRDRFAHVRRDRLHDAAVANADPAHEFELWLLEQGWRRSPPIRRYVHFLSSMLALFTLIERRFPRPDEGSSDHKDAAAVQTTVGEMLVLARYLYYLDSHEVAGDILECGCFKGFSSTCLSWVCSYLGRKLIVADSFQGLPVDASQDYYRAGEFRGGFEEVQANLQTLGRPECVEFVRGFFSDSLPGFDRPLCMIWMDVDLHSSAMDVLNNVFPSLQPGGVIFSHELFDGRDFRNGRLLPDAGGPARALHEFYADQAGDYAATFCEGRLGLTVPRSKGPLAFSRSRQQLLARRLALATSGSLRDQAEAGPAHALRRSFRRLKKVPVLGRVLAGAREAVRTGNR